MSAVLYASLLPRLSWETLSKSHGSSSLSPAGALALVTYLVVFQRDHPLCGDLSDPSRPASARLTFFVTCLFSFVFFSCYSGLLTATMIGAESELSVESMLDLEASDLSLHLWEDSSTFDSFKDAPPESPRGKVYKAKVEGKLDEVFINSNEEIHAKLVKQVLFIPAASTRSISPPPTRLQTLRAYTWPGIPYWPGTPTCTPSETFETLPPRRCPSASRRTPSTGRPSTTN